MLVIHSEARDEVRDAMQWYADASVEVARRFSLRLNDAIGRLVSAPQSWAIHSGQCHYVPIVGFPYIVVFHLPEPDTITIVAVSHTSRRPGYWRSRLR